MNHYRTLGIEPTASPAEVRTAFRNAARVNHPDASGGSSDRMAMINEAWRVLGDPSRRSAYDAASSVRTQAPAAEPIVHHTPQSYTPSIEPARFPWRFMAVMAGVGITVVVVLGAVASGPTEVPPADRLIGAGSCVVIEPNGDAAEVHCTEPNDGVVEALVAFDEVCTFGLEPHRDKQGLGVACVRVP